MIVELPGNNELLESSRPDSSADSDSILSRESSDSILDKHNSDSRAASKDTQWNVAAAPYVPRGQTESVGLPESPAQTTTSDYCSQGSNCPSAGSINNAGNVSTTNLSSIIAAYHTPVDQSRMPRIQNNSAYGHTVLPRSSSQILYPGSMSFQQMLSPMPFHHMPPPPMPKHQMPPSMPSEQTPMFPRRMQHKMPSNQMSSQQIQHQILLQQMQHQVPEQRQTLMPEEQQTTVPEPSDIFWYSGPPSRLPHPDQPSSDRSPSLSTRMDEYVQDFLRVHPYPNAITNMTEALLSGTYWRYHEVAKRLGHPLEHHNAIGPVPPLVGNRSPWGIRNFKDTPSLLDIWNPMSGKQESPFAELMRWQPEAIVQLSRLRWSS